MVMKASNESFSAYLDRVKGSMPEGFEQSLADEGLSMGTTAYVYMSFMSGAKADYCASELVRMNGVEVS